MNRNILIGAGLAAALMLVLLLAAGGQKPAEAKAAPRSLAESPIQKVAFMTEGSAPVPAAAPAEAPKAEAPKPEHK